MFIQTWSYHYKYQWNISSKLSSNSEADASELLEGLERNVSSVLYGQ